MEQIDPLFKKLMKSHKVSLLKQTKNGIYLQYRDYSKFLRFLCFVKNTYTVGIGFVKYPSFLEFANDYENHSEATRIPIFGKIAHVSKEIYNAFLNVLNHPSTKDYNPDDQVTDPWICNRHGYIVKGNYELAHVYDGEVCLEEFKNNNDTDPNEPNAFTRAFDWAASNPKESAYARRS